jgi:hypothetical protein
MNYDKKALPFPPGTSSQAKTSRDFTSAVPTTDTNTPNLVGTFLLLICSFIRFKESLEEEAWDQKGGCRKLEAKFWPERTGTVFQLEQKDFADFIRLTV